MRVTNQIMLNNMKLYLSRNMAALVKSQDMLASGHRINKPSDDPIGTINTMRFSTHVIETEEYLEKIDQSTNFMDTTDSALNNINSVLQRVRELVVYAANGTHNDESRRAIADEISQMREQLQLIANTTYGNKNIFSGTNVTTAPYDLDNDIWLGNSGKVELEIGNGVKIQINSVLQKFFYNTGSTMGGQAVDLSRLTSTSQLVDKTFNLVFDDLQKSGRFVTITQRDIDNTGCPTEQEFVDIVQSTLASPDTFTCTGGNFFLNGTQVYMTVNGHNIRTVDDLSKIDEYSDLTTGDLNFFSDNALSIPAGSTTISDANIAAAAPEWLPINDRYSGWGHPSAQDFSEIVNSALEGAADFSFSDGKFYLNGTQVYLRIGTTNIYNPAGLAKIQEHSDLIGNDLEIFTDQDMTIPAAVPSVSIDETDIAKATGWRSTITRTQFNNIAKSMAKAASAVGYNLEYNLTSGTYTVDGVTGTLQVDGVAVSEEFLATVDDHSALLGKVLTFVPSDSTKPPYSLGTFDASAIAVSDWGISPTGEQYKGALQNAINRSLGLMSDGKPRVLVTGTQDTGYSLQIMDPALLPKDGSPGQVKLRTLGTENLGTIGFAAAAMNLSGTDIEAMAKSYFSKLTPAGKYNITYDALTQQFSISVDGGPSQVGSLKVIGENGSPQVVDAAFLAASPTASDLLGKRLEFEVAGITYPAATPGQPVLTTRDLQSSTLLMTNEVFADSIRAALQNLNSAHTLETVGDPPTQILGMDGVKGTILIDGIAINDINAYLTENGNDFSKLVGKSIQFVPDTAAVSNNVITYVDVKTGAQVRENLTMFTMGGQGLNGRGVRYQDDDIGLLQLMDRIAIDVLAGNHDNIDGNLGILDDRMNTLNFERSIIGARVNRLELQRERMESSKYNYTTLLARYQDADMAQVIMDLNMQENVYRASLAAGARIIMPSLIDFLN